MNVGPFTGCLLLMIVVDHRKNMVVRSVFLHVYVGAYAAKEAGALLLRS